MELALRIRLSQSLQCALDFPILSINAGRSPSKRYDSLTDSLQIAKAALAVGPDAVILIEDDVEVDTTLRHHHELGFKSINALMPAEFDLPKDVQAVVHRISNDAGADGAAQSAVTATADATARGVSLDHVRDDHTFSDEEYNAYACPWHHNLTAAICSFRTARALERNPGSRCDVGTFKWHISEPVEWPFTAIVGFGVDGTRAMVLTRISRARHGDRNGNQSSRKTCPGAMP